MANQVAKKEEAGLPAEMMDDIFDTAGEGTTYEASELQIPFVRVAQGTSPQLKKSDMKHIADPIARRPRITSDRGLRVATKPCVSKSATSDETARSFGAG